MDQAKSLILLLGLCIFSGCVFQPGNVKVDVKKKNSLSNSTPKTISSVSVINNQIKVTGTGLAGVTSLKIQNNNLNETFSIESASATQIIANASHALSIGVGQIFDLILNSAEGAATFPVSFSLDNGSITAAMLSSMSASPGQILKYNGAAWVPSSISSSQLYIGTWNANTNSPDLNLTTPQAGDYYVVTTGGTQGAVTYAIGDWIISNGTTWSKLSHSSSVVGSFNGRTGLVVPTTGDYTWAQINKTSSKLEDIADIDITSRVDQKVLKWDATNSKWIMGNDNTGAGAPGPGSITTTEILDGTIANADLAGSIAQSKITNLTTDLASKLGLTSLSATSPLGYDNTTGVFSITNATIALDGAMSAADKTKLNGLEALSAGNGLLERFSGTLRSNTCADGEVLKWVTLTGWTCSPDSATDATKQTTLTDSAGLAAALSDESGTGLTVFNTAPTITNPVINNIAPGANFTLTQNSIAPFTSVNAGAVADTLYLNAGKVGVGTNTPGSSLDIKGTLRLSGATSGYVGFAPAAAAGTSTYTLPTTQGSAGQVLSTDGVASTPTLSWVTPATSSISLVGDIGGSVGANIIGNDKVTSTHLLDGTILNADINNAANIAITKLGTGAVSTTEFNYLTGVTSSIQTQLAAKEATLPTGATTDYIRGDKTLSVFATDVINSVLSTYTISALAKPAIASTDTVVGAFNKVQKYISDIDGDYVSKSASTNNTVSGVVTFNTIGSLNIGYTPTNATDAVSKAYVDVLGVWAKGAGVYAGDLYRLTGNVGIGTSTPSTPLDVTSGNGGYIRLAAADGGLEIASGNDVSSYIDFRGSTNLAADFKGRIEYTDGSGMGLNVDSNIIPSLYIKESNGNVGIGTTSPQKNLHVKSGASFGDTTGFPPAYSTVYNEFHNGTLFKNTATNAGAGTPYVATGSYYMHAPPANGNVDGYGNVAIAFADILTGIVNTGQMTGNYVMSLRNHYSANTDNGFLTNLFGQKIDFGNDLSELGNTPTTENAYGIFVYPRAATGTITNLYAIYLASVVSGGTLTNSWGMYQADSNAKNYFAGNIGIGETAPRAKLDVAGTFVGKASTLNATSTIDFSSGNFQYTAANCGAFALNNMKDGGTYTFVVKGTTSTTCSFTAFSDAGVTGLTFHLPPDNSATVTGKHTIYTYIVVGTDVYASWVPGV